MRPLFLCIYDNSGRATPIMSHIQADVATSLVEKQLNS